MNDAHDNAATDKEMLQRFEAKTATVDDAPLRYGDMVVIFNRYTCQVWKVAKNGSVMVSGYRGWVRPINVVLKTRAEDLPKVAQ